MNVQLIPYINTITVVQQKGNRNAWTHSHEAPKSIKY